MFAAAAQRSQDFDPDVCDLCGSRQWRTILQFDTPRALRSDRTILAERLEKRRCLRCGLARRGTAVTGSELERLYTKDYRGGAPHAHVFYTALGEVARSDAFADWFLTVAPEAFAVAGRGIEYGAGSGELVEALASRCPDAAFETFEPLRNGSFDSDGRPDRDPDVRGDGSYDVVWAVAVLEHVASPAVFLRTLRRLLRPGGYLVLAQPTQDVKSTDILFVDHLYHFGTVHLRQYAPECGFREIRHAVGHPLMPTFSLHLWRAAALESAGPREWEGLPASTCVDASVNALSGDLKRLDQTIDSCIKAGRRIAVFGLGEIFWMARCYSTLFDAPLLCGAVDQPDRHEYRALGFPVVTPERLPELGADVVLLTISPADQRRAGDRIAALGLTPVPVLPSFGHAG